MNFDKYGTTPPIDMKFRHINYESFLHYVTKNCAKICRTLDFVANLEFFVEIEIAGIDAKTWRYFAESRKKPWRRKSVLRELIGIHGSTIMLFR